jgi:pimeloyl-ACP methyl ester carboxylesterase
MAGRLRFISACAALVAVTVICVPQARAQTSSRSDTIYVAPPTGDRETDRASIQAAVEQVEPGGTIQFAPGTYLIGASIRIQVARLTLRGHPQGTTLRGCDPDEFATYGTVAEVIENCGGLRLLAGHQSVHDLTFEYASTGLDLGLMWEPGGAHRTEGGDRIMNNTFRMTGHGLILNGDWPEPSVISNNRFINSYHALVIFGGTAHVLDNHFSVPEPERVPIAGFPDEAVRILPRTRKAGDTLPAVCGRNVVAGNRIEGTLIGIEIRVREADTRCEGNVVRDNWIAVTPARVPEWSDYGAPDDSRIVYGMALALNDLSAEGSSAESEAAASRISANVIEGNRIIGGSGPAIQLYGAAGNRIVDNTITGVRLRETYPGHTQFLPPPGIDANGSGIWISRGSDGNEILGNTFEDIASYAIVIEGDSNRVTVRDASDAVRDLGRGNRVSGPGSSTKEVKPAEPLYESKFVEANGIRLQYMDFGGSGLPLIFVQDIHNYFEDEDPFFRDLWSGFYARFTDGHRVLATVKRGYGESDDPGWGYDVATQSEDLLGLMDALGIHGAVLVGRVPATQDLTWIAEHHPERGAGLVYLGNPGVLQRSFHPEARLFSENYARGSCDLEERGVALAGARGPWRPHFLDDETARIDVPALRFTHPVYDRRSMDLRRLDRLDAIAAEEPECPGHAQSLEYFRALAADPERRAALREALEASDASIPIEEGIQRAFGASMRTVVQPDLEGWPEFHDFFEPHIRRFLAELTAEFPGESSAALRRAPQAAPSHEWVDPSPHEVRYVTVAPAVQLEVLDWGGEGTPIVFVAGLSMNAHAFDDFAPRFTDTHHVVGLTRRGHGASSWSDDGYSLERRVEDLRVVLDSLGLERVVFAGHSMAGTEMTRFAGGYPERVAGLIYIDAAHDLSLIDSLRIPELCPMGPEILEAIERRFENPEAFRRTQRREATDECITAFQRYI